MPVRLFAKRRHGGVTRAHPGSRQLAYLEELVRKLQP